MTSDEEQGAAPAVFHRTEFGGQQRSERRPVVVHYHAFKNAGTSVDTALSRSFPGGWANYDGPVPEFFIHQSELEIIAGNRAQLKAISSHQARLPVPRSDRVEFLPIAFVRRPELRIASIWRYTRKRADEHPATLHARRYEFPEWLDRCLHEITPQNVKNLQVYLYAFGYNRRPPATDAERLRAALLNLASVPFVGIVEAFDQSMDIYEDLYASYLPGLRLASPDRRNVTAAPADPDEQLADLRRHVGNDLFTKLQQANAEDIEFYEACRRRLAECETRRPHTRQGMAQHSMRSA